MARINQYFHGTIPDENDWELSLSIQQQVLLLGELSLFRFFHRQRELSLSRFSGEQSLVQGLTLGNDPFCYRRELSLLHGGNYPCSAFLGNDPLYKP